MAKKNNGIKRHGNSRGSWSLADRIKHVSTAAQNEVDESARANVFCGKTYSEDTIIIALHRMGLGWGPTRFAKLHKILYEVRKELEDIEIEDKSTGMQLYIASATLDKELEKAVGKENFVPFNVRYGGEEITHGLRTFELAERQRAKDD